MADYLELISADGLRFSINKNLVNSWAMMTEMMEILGDDPDSQIPLQNVKARELRRIIDWSQATLGTVPPPNQENGAVVSLMEADREYFEDIESEELIEVAHAANYLGIERLLDVTTQLLADLIRDKEPDAVREIFNLEYDLTEKDENRLREEHRLINDEL